MSTPPQLIGLKWALKRTFLAYIAHAPGGKATLSGGAAATSLQEILFESDSRDLSKGDAGITFLAFRGVAAFTAYYGMLAVRIADPWVTMEGDHGSLTVLDPAQPPEGDARLELATFDLAGHTISDGLELWTAAGVKLTPEGCSLFNDAYQVGESLEPFTIALPARATSPG